ncbi:hypothetical protein MIAR_24150 [Microbacterium arabinogalactanolyticum]|nr:hypothetical protein MIAR_24150 [Microbacterium arabinogalactanolyticum]
MHGAPGETKILCDQGHRASRVGVEHCEDAPVGVVEVGHIDHHCFLSAGLIGRIDQSESILWCLQTAVC